MSGRFAARATGVAERATRRVLLVRHDVHVGSLLELGLSRAGFEVLVADSDEHALRELAPEHELPDLLVTDGVSAKEGLSLAGRVRAQSRLAHLPILQLSDAADSAAVELARVTGVDDCLPRPAFVQDVVALASMRAGTRSGQRLFELTSSEVSLVRVLRALLASARSGRVELANRSGSLSFLRGRVVSARFEGLEGQSALERMLVLASGDYTVTLGPGLGEGPMELSQQELWGRLLPQVRKWERALGEGLGMHERPEVKLTALETLKDGLPESTDTLLRLADGRRSVRQIVLECELPPWETLEAITRLHALEVLVPADRAEASTSTSNSAVAFSRGFADLGPRLRLLDAPGFEGRELPPEAPTPAAPGRRSRVEGVNVAVHTPPAELVYFPALPRTERVGSTPPALARDSRSARVLDTLARTLLPLSALVAVLGGVVLFLGATAAPGHFENMTSEAKVAASPSSLAPGQAVPAAEVPPEVTVRLIHATALYKDGQVASAARELEAVVVEHPEVSEAWSAVALARYDMGNVPGATLAAAMARDLKPAAPESHLLLASFLLAGQNEEGARGELWRVLEIDPDGRFADSARRLLARLGEGGVPESK
jgi:DNA-binding response OmpR family regulator